MNGLLIRRSDPDELARSVIRLLADPALAATLAPTPPSLGAYSIERHTDAICGRCRRSEDAAVRALSGQSAQD